MNAAHRWFVRSFSLRKLKRWRKGSRHSGDPTRLRLISLVAAHEDAEACVCELTEPVGLSQPTVSHHLKILVDAGILTRDQRGIWAYYRLVPGSLNALAALITTPVA